MLTGVYPHRHGMVQNHGALGSRAEFDPDTRLFSHYLRAAGYRCGYFGKWHCGDKSTALDFGFEGWSTPGYGHAYWTQEYAEYLEEKGLPQAAVDLEWHIRNRKEFGRRIVLKDEPDPFHHMACSGVLVTPVETHEAYFVTHRANQWLEERAGDGEPFCLRVDVWGPHQPYFVGKPFAGTVNPRAIPEYPNFSFPLEGKPLLHRKFRDAYRRDATARTWSEWQPVVARCYEHASQVDAALGRVVDTLERLGLSENTVVFYVADHGDAIAWNGGFDKDSLMIEETTRIPLAMRWPGHVPAGEICNGLVTNMDMMPTVLELAGAETPSPMHGDSLLAIARDPVHAAGRQDLMCEHHGHCIHAFQRLLRWQQYKYVAHLDDMDELYDLEQDPWEHRNLARDPGKAPVLDEMRERLARRMAEFEDDSADAQRLLADIGVRGGTPRSGPPR